MAKETVYLDTSVPSAFFDSKWLYRQQITQEFWPYALTEYQLAISEVTLAEIEATPDLTRRQEMLGLVATIPILDLSPRAALLSLEFLAANLVPAKKREDARHLAIAVENGFDFLVSWNFEHMVNAKTQKRLPVVSAQQGYFKQLLIVSPEAFKRRSKP